MKSLFYTAITSFAFAMLLSSCAHSNNGGVDIRALNQQFINAWNSKDSAKINSFFSDSVQFLQGKSHYSGKGEVTRKWVSESLPAISNLKTSEVSSYSDNNMAYEGGTFSVDVTAPNQPDAFGEGNFVFIWKKGTDGNWKLNYAQLEDLPLQIKH